MNEKLGVKETKEMCDFVVDLAKNLIEAGKDGFQPTDASLLLNLIPTVGPAFTDMGKIPAEVKDMDVEEAAALVAHVAARLALENKEAQAVVEKSLKTAVAIYDLIVAIKALNKPEVV